MIKKRYLVACAGFLVAYAGSLLELTIDFAYFNCTGNITAQRNCFLAQDAAGKIPLQNKLAAQTTYDDAFYEAVKKFVNDNDSWLSSQRTYNTSTLKEYIENWKTKVQLDAYNGYKDKLDTSTKNVANVPSTRSGDPSILSTEEDKVAKMSADLDSAEKPLSQLFMIVDDSQKATLQGTISALKQTINVKANSIYTKQRNHFTDTVNRIAETKASAHEIEPWLKNEKPTLLKPYQDLEVLKNTLSKSSDFENLLSTSQQNGILGTDKDPSTANTVYGMMAKLREFALDKLKVQMDRIYKDAETKFSKFADTTIETPSSGTITALETQIAKLRRDANTLLTKTLIPAQTNLTVDNTANNYKSAIDILSEEQKTNLKNYVDDYVTKLTSKTETKDLGLIRRVNSTYLQFLDTGKDASGFIISKPSLRKLVDAAKAAKTLADANKVRSDLAKFRTLSTGHYGLSPAQKDYFGYACDYLTNALGKIK